MIIFLKNPGDPFPGAYPEKIAIIGAGPAGLAAANDLALLGYSCTIFESNATPGGMLTMGVPTYRLPRASIDNDVNVIKKLGVEIRYNATFGADITFDSLKKDGFSDPSSIRRLGNVFHEPVLRDIQRKDFARFQEPITSCQRL